jgi:hypothetical protein
MIEALRIYDNLDNINITMEDITKNLCMTGIASFLELHPECQQLNTITAKDLMSVYNGTEIRTMLRNLKTRRDSNFSV